MHVLKFVIAGDANNFIERARLAGGFVKAKPFAEGILAVEDFSPKRLIDDSHFRGSGSIAVIEAIYRAAQRPEPAAKSDVG